MKKSVKLLGIAAVVLVLVASLGSAISYFTTYAEARGGKIFKLNTTIEEEVYDWTKHVVISSNPESTPVYVRAKAFAPAQYPLDYKSAVDGDWVPGDDGYWYYTKVLQNGSSTTELLVHISDIPEEPKDGDEFNVVVIYESTYATNEAGDSVEADWTKLISNEEDSE